VYKNLENLNPLGLLLLSNLQPMAADALNEIRQLSPNFPEEYLIFLQEHGFGIMREDESSLPLLVINQQPIDAAKDYFGDDLIYSDGPYEPGAKGTVWLFGSDSMGNAFGFDSGDNWSLMEIDNFRSITRLKLNFKQFIEGLFVCYPQKPISFSSGIWRDSGGGEYSVAVKG